MYWYNEKRCETCAHWNKVLMDYGTCLMAELVDGEDRPDSLAFADGRDGNQHWLTTNKDFGCVQWAPHEPT